MNPAAIYLTVTNEDGELLGRVSVSLSEDQDNPLGSPMAKLAMMAEIEDAARVVLRRRLNGFTRVKDFLVEYMEVYPGALTPTAVEIRDALDTTAEPIKLSDVVEYREWLCCVACDQLLDAPEAECRRCEVAASLRGGKRMSGGPLGPLGDG